MFGGLGKIDAGCWRRRELAPAPPPLYDPPLRCYTAIICYHILYYTVYIHILCYIFLDILLYCHTHSSSPPLQCYTAISCYDMLYYTTLYNYIYSAFICHPHSTSPPSDAILIYFDMLYCVHVCIKILCYICLDISIWPRSYSPLL